MFLVEDFSTNSVLKFLMGTNVQVSSSMGVLVKAREKESKAEEDPQKIHQPSIGGFTSL